MKKALNRLDINSLELKNLFFLSKNTLLFSLSFKITLLFVALDLKERGGSKLTF